MTTTTTTTRSTSKTLSMKHLGESEFRTMPFVPKPTVSVSMKAAVKMLYPLLVHELRECGYTEAEVIHRLRECCSSDHELVALIDKTVKEFEELCH